MTFNNRIVKLNYKFNLPTIHYTIQINLVSFTCLKTLSNRKVISKSNLLFGNITPNGNINDNFDS